ncbi:MAG TPA: hypothetical protein VF595_09565 [Tepidisphaeraceae bacterium]
MSSKLLIQIGTLYYLTTTLGRDGSGSFFAVIGLLACLVPFVQLGNYDLTIRQIARREDPQAVAGRAMRISFAAFFAILPLLVVLRMVLAKDISWTAFMVVATGELLVMRITTNVQAIATGFRLHYVVAVCDFLIGASRFVAVYVASRWNAGVDVMLTLYAFTSLPTAIATYLWMVHRIGSPQWRGGRLFDDFAEHRRMVIAWFAEMAASQGDKPLLKALSDAGQTGIYGTATKLFGVTLIPIDLLSQVFRPRVSQAYADGESHGRRLGQVMAMALFASGVIGGAGLFVGAWLLPWLAPQIAASEFGEARYALMYLAVIPPIYGLQRANIITAIARGATGAYASATTIAAAAGLAVLVAGAPRFGWQAACAAYFVYVLTSCIATWRFSGERPESQAAPAVLQAA